MDDVERHREIWCSTDDWLGCCQSEFRAEIERLQAENERATAECARLNELFALKWDATQSAETEVLAAEIERLTMLHDNAKHWEAQWLADNERLRAALTLSQSQNYCTLCGTALEPKP